MKQTITRQELSRRFEAGAERKMRELEYFRIMEFERPEKASLYGEIVRFLEYEARYYRVAAAYYGDSYESLSSGEEDDLLFLTKVSETDKRTYAQYLREIDPSARDDERLTRACLEDLKNAMKTVMESGRV